MNYQRGLIRLCVLLSIIWLALGIIKVHSKIYNSLDLGERIRIDLKYSEVSPIRRIFFDVGLFFGGLRARHIYFIFLPIVGLWIVHRLGFWVVNGFKKNPATKTINKSIVGKE